MPMPIHRVAVAMATTAAIGAFALLPLSAAYADDAAAPGHGQDDTSTSAPTTTTDDDATPAPAAAPTRVHLDARSDDAVRVSWHFDGEATGFTVTVTSTVGGTVVQQVADPAARTTTVSTLAPDTRYRATVTAITADGTDPVSAVSNTAPTKRSHLGEAAERAKKAAERAAKQAEKAAELAAKARHRADHLAGTAAEVAAKQAEKAARAAARATRTAHDLEHAATKAEDRARHEQETDRQDERGSDD